MANLSNMELQNLRHIMMSEQLKAVKSDVFAQQVSNPQLKSFLENKSQQARDSVNRLNQFLNAY
ncbi:MAG: hypothetical protein ACOCZ3_03330 [Bacillota bacterium]